MEVQGRTLLLKRGGRTRQMDMDAVPELAALLDALRATLDRRHRAAAEALQHGAERQRRQVGAALLPLDERLARQVRQIELVGQAADLRSIELQLTGGDRSLMLMEPLQVPATK
jgi:hypothetical protein